MLRDPANPAAGFVPFVRDTFTPDRLTTAEGRALDVGLYVRDAWRLTSRLSLDLGARVDVIRRFDDQFGVDTQRSLEFGPRLGVTYALAADAASVVRASWGRIHDALSTNTIAVGDSAPEQQSAFDTDLDGVFETVFTFPALTVLSDRYRLDPDRSQPYVNEWTIGYGHRLPGQISVDAAIIRRAYRNRTAFVEVNGHYDGNRFVGYRNPATNDDLRGHRKPLELAGLHGIRDAADASDRSTATDRRLHPRVSTPGGHLAAERSGLVHPAGGVSE